MLGTASEPPTISEHARIMWDSAWGDRRDSNPQPLETQSSALPVELRTPCGGYCCTSWLAGEDSNPRHRGPTPRVLPAELPTNEAPPSGFEPKSPGSEPGVRANWTRGERRLSANWMMSSDSWIDGARRGGRTRTVRVLNPVPLPVGIDEHDHCVHRGGVEPATDQGLSLVPLPVGLPVQECCWRDSNPHCRRSRRRLSASWSTAACSGSEDPGRVERSRTSLVSLPKGVPYRPAPTR